MTEWRIIVKIQTLDSVIVLLSDAAALTSSSDDFKSRKGLVLPFRVLFFPGVVNDKELFLLDAWHPASRDLMT